MHKTVILVPNTAAGFCLRGMIVSLLLVLVGACGQKPQVSSPKPVFQPVPDFVHSFESKMTPEEAQEVSDLLEPRVLIGDEDLYGNTYELSARGNFSPLTGLEEDDCWYEGTQMYCREVKFPCRYDPSTTSEDEACWRIFPVGKE